MSTTPWYSIRDPKERAEAKAIDEARISDRHADAKIRLEQCFAIYPAARKIRPRLRASMPAGDAYLLLHLGNRRVPINGPDEFRATVRNMVAWRLRRLREYRRDPAAKDN